MCRQFKSVSKQKLFMKNYLWNMFANIQNGQQAQRSFIIQNKKKICESFLNILWNEGFISGYKTLNSTAVPKLKIFLKYVKNQPVIHSIKAISKPSNRVHFSVKQIWKLNSESSLLIFSTNKGLLTCTQCKKLNTGGELFAVIN